MEKLKNGIYILSYDDSIKDLAYAFNNNFNVILYFLLSEPQLMTIGYVSESNAIVTGNKLEVYRSTVSVTGIEYVSTNFNEVASYITDITAVPTYPNAGRTQTLITLRASVANQGTLRIAEWLELLCGVVANYIIGTDLSLISWVTLNTPKDSINSCRSSITKSSTKLGTLAARLSKTQDTQNKIRQIKDYLTQYKEEFQSHVHDATDIKTGFFDAKTIASGTNNVTTYLSGDKKWTKLSFN